MNLVVFKLISLNVKHTIFYVLGGRVIAVKADLAKIGLTNPGKHPS